VYDGILNKYIYSHILLFTIKEINIRHSNAIKTVKRNTYVNLCKKCFSGPKFISLYANKRMKNIEDLPVVSE
jgi:hypothetical protein